MAGSCAAQNDSDGFFDYQFEPVWKFCTGSIQHTLLTGFEYQHQIMDTQPRHGRSAEYHQYLRAGAARIVTGRLDVPVRRQAFLRQ